MTTSRKIVAGLFVSVDGVVDSPASSAHSWATEELMATMAAGLGRADTVLLGPATYRMFAKIWQPQGDNGHMATFLNRAPKSVVSHMPEALDTLDWQPATMIRGDLRDELTNLKNQPGKNIQVPGSPRLVRSLLCEGLLDELSLNICPVVVGGGFRLFDDLPNRVNLHLLDSVAFANGVVGATCGIRPPE
jgi:dihydrofolate reductase